MTMPRSETVVEGVVGVYHCISRCVRRAFLCGMDDYSGKDYGHRKVWIQKRLRAISEAFAIDVFGYSIMSNHLHVVLRNRPDTAETWPDDEVARRWLAIFPKRWSQNRPERPRKGEIAALVADRNRLAALRARLSNVSWFMRMLNEYISRRSNREDDCKGHFWESRFKCQRLLDETALFTCMAYVDLNPVRAGAAHSIEDSDFTSAKDRVEAARARRKIAHYKALRKSAQGLARRQETLLARERVNAKRDTWLSGFGGSGRGELSLSAADYLAVLDDTGRHLRSDKRGSISPDLAPVLARLDIDATRWTQTIDRYGSMFWRMAGRAETMIAAAKQAGLGWLRGSRAARAAFGDTS